MELLPSHARLDDPPEQFYQTLGCSALYSSNLGYLPQPSYVVATLREIMDRDTPPMFGQGTLPVS